MEYSKTFNVRKPVRFISGVIVVAVMTRPYPCPHGRCLYCPGGVTEDTPQSYVKKSPAVLRAVQYDYDPYFQTQARLKQYVAMGHSPSKVEIIIMGGTFPAMPLDYQEWFVANVLEALNRFPRGKPRKWIYLEDAQRRNEHANIRCVGLTIETRPDWSQERQIDRFLHLGATRIELGVQTIYEEVLRRIRRGHTVNDTVRATQLLKDAGYKVVYHLMPGLPGSDFDRDFGMFKTIFEDPRFRPDMLKIYPTLVIPGTKLYEEWKRGIYKPYTNEEIVEFLVKVLALIPKYVRIMRIQRDVPVSCVAAGLTIGNLREVVYKRALERGVRPREMRFREVGHVFLREGKIPSPQDIRLMRLDYEASNGVEVFLSYEDPVTDSLIAFLRLRIPSPNAHRREIDSRTAIVRELHVYGPQVPVGAKSPFWWQHKGFGRKLLWEAERIASEEFDCKRMIIISGIGVRDYYRKLGYRRLKGSFYMGRRLS